MIKLCMGYLKKAKYLCTLSIIMGYKYYKFFKKLALMFNMQFYKNCCRHIYNVTNDYLYFINAVLFKESTCNSESKTFCILGVYVDIQTNFILYFVIHL